MTAMGVHRPGDGYWIAPTGHVLRLAHRHITAVCQRPEAFGIYKPELEVLFASRGEAWASEQSAREVVIKALVNQARWIRVRHYHRRHGHWSINVPALAPEQRARVGAFFRLLGDSVDPDDRVRLDAPGKEHEWSNVRSLASTYCVTRSLLVLVEDLQGLPKSSVQVQFVASGDNLSVLSTSES